MNTLSAHIKKLRWLWMKWRLKRAYLRLRRLQDDYSCGVTLAAYINPKIDKLSTRVDHLLARCNQLDPTQEGGNNGL